MLPGGAVRLESSDRGLSVCVRLVLVSMGRAMVFGSEGVWWYSGFLWI